MQRNLAHHHVHLEIFHVHVHPMQKNQIQAGLVLQLNAPYVLNVHVLDEKEQSL